MRLMRSTSKSSIISDRHITSINCTFDSQSNYRYTKTGSMRLRDTGQRSNCFTPVMINDISRPVT